MKYNNLRILVVISIGFGIIASFCLFSISMACGYYEYWGDWELRIGSYGYYWEYQYPQMIGLIIGSISTLVAFTIFPLLYLRLKNKEKEFGESKKKL